MSAIDDDGAPCEEVVEQAVFFWNEFAISYRRGKMFRVGRLNDPAKPYKYKEIKDPERRQAYIDAGREPVEREIDYKDDPVTLNDTFGFFQMSFIEAYEKSGISFTMEEAKIIVECKRKRNIMASLPMDEVVSYQEMELRILCRMMDKLRETTNSLGLDLPHCQGAGAISMAMANKHRARDFYPAIRGSNYLPQQEWAHYCFAGGRIEMMKQGRVTEPLTGQSEAVPKGEAVERRFLGPETNGLRDKAVRQRGLAGTAMARGVLTRDAARQTKMIYGYDITSAYPSKQFGLLAMALPIEWELKKNGSLGNVKTRIEGKWIWREGAELN